MSTTRRVAAVLVALVGAIFLGQGIDLIPGSFMTGQAIWAVIGLALLSTSLFVLVRRK